MVNFSHFHDCMEQRVWVDIVSSLTTSWLWVFCGSKLPNNRILRKSDPIPRKLSPHFTLPALRRQRPRVYLSAPLMAALTRQAALGVEWPLAHCTATTVWLWCPYTNAYGLDASLLCPSFETISSRSSLHPLSVTRAFAESL